MLYGLSRNLCQNSAKTVRTVRKYTQKYITTVTSISLPRNVVWQLWNACQYSQKLQLLSSSIFVHIIFCMTSTNPYGTACFLAVWNPYFSLLWDVFSPSANAVSFLSSTSLLLSLVLSTRILELLLFSQQECFSSSCSLNKNAATFLFLASHQEPLGISPRVSNFLLLLLASHQEPLGISPRVSSLHTQEWVRPLALINLMREGEEFSNLTAEIRLDGWLRFGVSSLTLTSIIKLSFNLHLTN